MQWSRLTGIPGIDIKVLKHCEVVDGEGLVALGCQVQHVAAVFVPQRVVGTLLHQQADRVIPPVEGRKVQGCEALYVLRVNPLFELSAHFQLGVLENGCKEGFTVFEGRE